MSFNNQDAGMDCEMKMIKFLKENINIPRWVFIA